MKRFEFRLARLARVRRIEERRAHTLWQAAESQARSAQERVQAAQQEVVLATETLRQAQSDKHISALDVLNIDSAIVRLVHQVSLARSDAQRLQALAQDKRLPWQKLRTELEGLVRLEDKARKSHRAQYEREQALQMDQIASERAARGGLDAFRVSSSRQTLEPGRSSAQS